MLVLWPVHQLGEELNQYPGIMSISALLKQHGYASEAVPADFDAITDRLRSRPDALLAYSTPTPYYQFYRDLNKRIKREFPGILSVFGGAHPTYFPEMIEDEGVDAVCVGEGEYPMLELVQRTSRGESVVDIPNWRFRRGGEIIQNPIRPLLADLSDLPIPDHDLFFKAMPVHPIQSLVITTRGCPHHCTYCYNHAYRQIYRGKGKITRRRSVDHVMSELRELALRGIRYIRFMDDLFTLSPEWIAEFSERYSAEIGLPFSCLVRPEYVTEPVVAMLKKAGCYRMLMGLETADERLRSQVLNRKMSREAILDAARIIKAGGIKMMTTNILMIPGGSLESDWETIRLNIACGVDFAFPSIMQPYPMTEIATIAENMGLLERKHSREIEFSFGFGLTSPLIFENPRDKRLGENLSRFFSLVVKFPWLTPLVRWLIRLPPNRVFDAIYKVSSQLANHLCAMPPSLGLRTFWRRTSAYRVWRRLYEKRAKAHLPGKRSPG